MKKRTGVTIAAVILVLGVAAILLPKPKHAEPEAEPGPDVEIVNQKATGDPTEVSATADTITILTGKCTFCGRRTSEESGGCPSCGRQIRGLTGDMDVAVTVCCDLINRGAAGYVTVEAVVRAVEPAREKRLIHIEANEQLTVSFNLTIQMRHCVEYEWLYPCSYYFQVD